MIRAVDDHELLWLGERSPDFFQLRSRSKLIAAAADKELRLLTKAQKIQIIAALS